MAVDQFWFLHLPKNAGTSFWRLTKQNYQRSVRIDHDGPFSDSEHQEIVEAEAVGGHFRYGTHKIGTSPQLVTVLRHPVPRMRSFYDYIRTHPTHFDYGVVSGMSFDEFVSSDLEHVSNQQTERLGGADAARNLTTFQVVGVHERIGEFVAEVAERFGWAHATLPRVNVNRGRRVQVSNAARQVILDRNSLDLALWETVA